MQEAFTGSMISTFLPSRIAYQLHNEVREVSFCNIHATFKSLDSSNTHPYLSREVFHGLCSTFAWQLLLQRLYSLLTRFLQEPNFTNWFASSLNADSNKLPNVASFEEICCRMISPSSCSRLSVIFEFGN